MKDYKEKEEKLEMECQENNALLIENKYFS